MQIPMKREEMHQDNNYLQTELISQLPLHAKRWLFSATFRLDVPCTIYVHQFQFHLLLQWRLQRFGLIVLGCSHYGGSCTFVEVVKLTCEPLDLRVKFVNHCSLLQLLQQHPLLFQLHPPKQAVLAKAKVRNQVMDQLAFSCLILRQDPSNRLTAYTTQRSHSDLK